MSMWRKMNRGSNPNMEHEMHESRETLAQEMHEHRNRMMGPNYSAYGGMLTFLKHRVIGAKKR